MEKQLSTLLQSERVAQSDKPQKASDRPNGENDHNVLSATEEYNRGCVELRM